MALGRDWTATVFGPCKHAVAAAAKWSVRSRALALASAMIAGTLATPASAAREPSARLVRCGAHSCLLVTGQREDPAAIVRINGRSVPVEGDRGWQVRLSLETLRQWAAPHARSIEVSMRDPATQRDTVEEIDLPIGLLGDVTNLAFLEVRAD